MYIFHRWSNPAGVADNRIMHYAIMVKLEIHDRATKKKHKQLKKNDKKQKKKKKTKKKKKRKKKSKNNQTK
jgi:hypothetical protein